MSMIATFIMILAIQTTPPAPAPRDVFVDTGRSLIDSASDSKRSRARARGWLDQLAGQPLEDLASGLESQPTEDDRLAYIEGWTSAQSGLNRSTELDQRAMEILATGFENDDLARIHAWSMKMSEPTVDWIAPETPSDLTSRPFWNSLETTADRIAAKGSSTNVVEMIEASTDATDPVVIAAVLSTGADQRHPEVALALAEAIPENPLVRASIAIELARRSAPTELAAFLRTYPDTLSIPGVYARTISALARDDPAAALEIGRGREIMRRVPSRGPASVFGSLAVGLAETDLDAAFSDLAAAGQADSRLIWTLALANRVSPDLLDPPATSGPLTEANSFRTVRANMLVPLLATGVVDRDAAAEVFAHLARNGRWEFVESFVRPNTTEPDRAADSWLPYRLDILSRAFAIAEFPPETWSELLRELPRLRTIDGQMAGLHAIATGFLSRYGDRPMPASVKRALNEASINIAING